MREDSAAKATSAVKNRVRALQDTTGETAVPSPASATISGDGVSPAASAAASGSPPGSAAATERAEDGRRAGSASRQRRMTRSTFGSNPSTKLDGDAGDVSDWRL